MIFIFKSDGSSINYTPSEINQGSIKANTIYFVAPVPITSVITCGCTLPNGDGTAKMLMTAAEENELTGIVDENDNAFNVWKLTTPEVLTAYAGTLKVQFFITADGSTLATERIDITVKQGAYIIEPEQGDTYQEVLNYLSAINTGLSDKMDKVPTATENHIAVFDNEGQVKDGGLFVNDYNGLANKPIQPQDLNAEDFTPTANTYYLHTGTTSTDFVNGGIYFYDGSSYGLCGDNPLRIIKGGTMLSPVSILSFFTTRSQTGVYLAQGWFNNTPPFVGAGGTFFVEFESALKSDAYYTLTVTYENSTYILKGTAIGDNITWESTWAEYVSITPAEKAAFENKQDALIAGTGISIANNVIAVTNKGGTFSVLSTDWINGSVTKQISDLSANDKIDIGALTYADQEKINEAQLFVTATTGSITITAQETPTTNIDFQYFITKGVA